jgi:predicted TIM-barrel fold metal-dependent hydrolase
VATDDNPPAGVPEGRATATRTVLPRGACDCDAQVSGPASLFPPNTDEEIPEATPAQFEKTLAALGLGRAVLVQPEFYGTDNRCLLQALARHRNIFRGIAAAGPETSDEELERIAHTGVRGLRVDARTEPFERIETLALRIEPLGWHLQLALDPTALHRLAPRLDNLPVDIVVEQLGRPNFAAGVRQPGFRALLRLVRAGRCWVKLTSGGWPWQEAVPFANALVAADPTRLVWGSGWPRAMRTADLFGSLETWATEPRLRHLILVENPARLYRFEE